jgi:uncharacterized protein (TIGR02271 family)
MQGRPARRPTGRVLPLEASRMPLADGTWLIALPVRAEAVEVTKEAVEVEEVVVRREATSAVERVEAQALREELRVDTTGAAEVV